MLNKKTGKNLLTVLPAAFFPIILFVFVLWPFITLGVESFKGESGAFTLERYVEVFTTRQYLESFLNTFLLSLLSTLLALFICIPAGIYIESKGGKDRKFLAVVLSIPLSLPGIVIGFFVIITVGFTGVIPKLIELIWGERRLSFAYTFWGMLLGYVYFQIPRIVLSIRGAVVNISEDVLAAAKILGASTFQIYIHIILPTLRPAIVMAASLSMATGFGAFGTAATLSRGYRVIPLEIATSFTENFQPKLAGALSIILVLITTLLLMFINSFSNLGGKQFKEVKK
ncbi:ABC transporter permease subunit [Treponema sp. OMZ 840]|uniref:ABC transporter permease n=1 Tax=Treponema sp. OMZ 840 TaxID=244313 RepID=UPI003D90D274